MYNPRVRKDCATTYAEHARNQYLDLNLVSSGLAVSVHNNATALYHQQFAVFTVALIVTIVISVDRRRRERRPQ